MCGSLTVLTCLVLTTLLLEVYLTVYMYCVVVTVYLTVLDPAVQGSARGLVRLSCVLLLFLGPQEVDLTVRPSYVSYVLFCLCKRST